MSAKSAAVLWNGADTFKPHGTQHLANCPEAMYDFTERGEKPLDEEKYDTTYFRPPVADENEQAFEDSTK